MNNISKIILPNGIIQINREKTILQICTLISQSILNLEFYVYR